MKNLAGLALFCACAFVAGCASTAYMDPNDAPQNVHWRFNRYDFQLCSVAMTEDLLSDTQLAGRLRQQFPDRRPVLEMAHVENATFQHGIDLSIMTDTIRMRLGLVAARPKGSYRSNAPSHGLPIQTAGGVTPRSAATVAPTS